jgi:hypothetical protein
VSKVRRDVDTISFHVSEVGKPVEVRESFFPNWKVKGAKGPYRLAPNLMVVIPTSNDVTLTYGLTTVDWLGRILTLLGAFGVGLLVLWKGATRYAAGSDDDRDDDTEPDDETDGDGNGNGDDFGAPEPPEWREPEPALP